MQQQDGFSLLETLIALAVVALFFGVLLPPIVLNSLFKAVTALSIAGRAARPAAAILALSALAPLALVPFVLQ